MLLRKRKGGYTAKVTHKVPLRQIEMPRRVTTRIEKDKHGTWVEVPIPPAENLWEATWIHGPHRARERFRSQVGRPWLAANVVEDGDVTVLQMRRNGYVPLALRPVWQAALGSRHLRGAKLASLAARELFAIGIIETPVVAMADGKPVPHLNRVSPDVGTSDAENTVSTTGVVPDTLPSVRGRFRDDFEGE